MLTWEPAFDKIDKGKKWLGEKGFYNLEDSLYARGMRILMKPNTKFIGITDLKIFRKLTAY
jgi:hypothetical protein